jgi:hypothetical protein
LGFSKNVIGSQKVAATSNEESSAEKLLDPRLSVVTCNLNQGKNELAKTI